MWSASKSYSERLFRYARIDRLTRDAADAALTVPAREEGFEFEPDALDASHQATGGYPYFVRAYGKRPGMLSPGHRGRPQAESELAVGFFGSRYERAPAADREYLRAMAEASDQVIDNDDAPTAAIAQTLGRPAQSLSLPAGHC